jgi:hypothetical protein
MHEVHEYVLPYANLISIGLRLLSAEDRVNDRLSSPAYEKRDEQAILDISNLAS